MKRIYLYSACSKLVLHQAIIRTLFRQQLLMRSLFGYTAVLHHDDEVRTTDGAQPVRHHHHRTVAIQVIVPHATDNLLLRMAVQCIRGLVQED